MPSNRPFMSAVRRVKGLSIIATVDETNGQRDSNTRRRSERTKGPRWWKECRPFRPAVVAHLHRPATCGSRAVW